MAIRCTNLSKSYPIYESPRQRLLDLFRFKRRATREFPALTDVSFEVERGTIFGIVGKTARARAPCCN